MRWARSKAVSRLIACVMLASLLPVLIVPDGFAASESVQSPFERWVRGQLRGPATEAVELALDAAADVRARTIEEFVEAFLAAYDDGTPASQVFTDRELSEEALISYLQRRFHGVAAEGVLPRHQLVAAGFVTATSPGGATLIKFSRDGSPHIRTGVRLLQGVTIPTYSFHALNPARPQGP